ncbi:MAG: type II secretion system protein GspF [Candidatus Xenobia bacterium]
MGRTLALFTRGLATLVSSGVPLGRALQVMAATRVLPEEVADGLIGTLLRGHSLSDGFKAYPAHFPTSYVAAVRAAEGTGALVEVLLRLADQTEKSARLRHRLLSQLSYPVVLLISCGLGLAVLVLGFVPMMLPMLEQWNAPAPWLLVTLTGLARSPVTWVMLGLGLVNLLLAVLLLQRRPALRSALERSSASWPLVGGVRLRLARLQALDTLILLQEAGVPARTCLLEAARGQSHAELAARLREADAALLEGAELTAALRQARVFSPPALQLLLAGEAAGRLARLMRCARKLEEDALEARIELLVTLSEPLVLSVMGLAVGLVTLITLMPMLTLLARL